MIFKNLYKYLKLVLYIYFRNIISVIMTSTNNYNKILNNLFVKESDISTDYIKFSRIHSRINDTTFTNIGNLKYIIKKETHKGKQTVLIVQDIVDNKIPCLNCTLLNDKHFDICQACHGFLSKKIKVKENNDLVDKLQLAHFYQDYSYNKAFFEIIKNTEEHDNYKLIISFKNYNDFYRKVDLFTDVYINRNYLSKLFTMSSFPNIITNMIEDSAYYNIEHCQKIENISPVVLSEKTKKLKKRKNTKEMLFLIKLRIFTGC